VQEFCIKPKNALFILGTLAENPGLEVTAQPVVDVEPVRSSSSSGFCITINSFSLNLSSPGHSDTAVQQRLAAMLNSAPQQQIRVAPGVTVITAKTPLDQKAAEALTKAGISNPAAWAAAGVSPAAAGTGVQAALDPSAANPLSNPSNTESNAAANGFDSHPRVVLMRGQNNKTFLISWRSQKEVARTLGWKCTLMIWGGPVLALFSLYIFLGIEKLF